MVESAAQQHQAHNERCSLSQQGLPALPPLLMPRKSGKRVVNSWHSIATLAKLSTEL